MMMPLELPGDLRVSEAFKGTAATTAGARAANAVAAKFSGRAVKAAQQLGTASEFVAGVLGLNNNESKPQPLLGGMSLADARKVYDELRLVKYARKSLFFIEVEDRNPPKIIIPASNDPMSNRGDESLSSKAAAALSALQKNPFVALNGAIKKAASDAIGIKPPAAANSLSDSVPYLMNLFAVNVNYGANTIAGDKVRIGGGSIDVLAAAEHTELTLVTYDDEVGTLKRWFEEKCAQAVHADGSFGLPDDYCINITVYHATPVANKRAYRAMYRMRPAGLSHELARGEQGLAELTMTFTQFDTFI
jgi:hypothetical protein